MLDNTEKKQADETGGLEALLGGKLVGVFKVVVDRRKVENFIGKYDYCDNVMEALK